MRLSRSTIGVLLLTCLVALGGCRLELIAPYDPTLDGSMTQVQRDTELFFNQLAEGHDLSYAASVDFYAKTEATLRTLRTRAEAAPKSTLVADQIGRIESTFERVQGMHKRDNTLSPQNLTGDRQTLESEFRSFFRLELALRNHLAAPPTNALAPTTKP